MNPETLWPRYARIWSAEPAARAQELPACLSEAATYADPQTCVEGHAALSAYMGGFQASMPGCGFEIDRVLHHHGRSLAHWHLVSPEGATLQHGISSASHAEDGRLLEITGFFL